MKRREKRLFQRTIKKRHIVLTYYKEGVLTEVFEEENGRLIKETFIKFKD